MRNKSNNIFALLTFIFVLMNFTSFGQDSIRAKKIKVLPVPAFGYSPETKTYVGAVTLFTINMYRDSVTRTSNAKFEVNYTWNKQVILESEWNYFFREEKWFTKGKIHYSKYPDLYYGIGSNTPESNKLSFDSRRFILEASALKNIGYKLFTGVNIRYTSYSTVNAENNVLIYPELTESSVFGLGYSLLKDTRNNLLTPTTGFYSYLNSTWHFAKSDYLKFTVDLRYYKTWKDKFTLANRFINDLNTGHPPFYDNALLGGDKFVRGYYLGRYRDNNLSSFQSEFRFPAFWKIYLATFGGLSNIYSAPKNLSLGNTKTNYGFGIRFLVDKTENTFLRLDYAIGQDGNDGFYISFGESF
jgi:outer membrane protein assembly factor BamA